MEELPKPEQPSQSGVEELNSEAPLPSQSSVTASPITESFEHKVGTSTPMPSESSVEVDDAKLIESNATTEKINSEDPLPSQSSVTTSPISESFEHKVGTSTPMPSESSVEVDSTKLSESNAITEKLDSEAPLPSQSSVTTFPINESFEHKVGTSTPMPSESSVEVDAPKLNESNATIESPSCPKPLEDAIVEPLVNSTKLVSSIELVGSGTPLESGGRHPNSPKPADVELDASKPSPSPLESGGESSKASTLPFESGDESPKSPYLSDTSIESPKLVASNEPEGSIASDASKPSPSPLESSGESPKASTLPFESGDESPKSPYLSNTSIDSPQLVASNEPGGSTASDAQSVGSSESPKSGSSLDLRRKSKLMASYSIQRPSKMNFLASQLELAASEREKDVVAKQEYKAHEETLREKRESLLKQMHVEQKKAKFERKASTRAGTSFRMDLNATKKDMRKEDLNKKKEEDERNKNLLLQRARDEKMLRKSIYQSNRTSLGSSSPGTPSSPTSSSPSIIEE